MTGETNLEKLLKSMKPILQQGEFVFCTVSPDMAQQLSINSVCQFKEAEGITLIALREEAERCGLSYIYPCRLITLNIHSSLEAVGFLAAIATKLAKAGISLNAVSAYYHDHLFVPSDRADEAMELLAEFSK